MKDKFKIFCTFMMILIAGALLNINSPQPSADTTINEGVIMPTGAYIDSYGLYYNFHQDSGSKSNSVAIKYAFKTYTDCTLKCVIVSPYVSDYYKGEGGNGRKGGFPGPGNYNDPDNRAYYLLRYGNDESVSKENADIDQQWYKDYTLQVIPDNNKFKDVDSANGTDRVVELSMDDDFAFDISSPYKLTGIFQIGEGEDSQKILVDNYINSAPGFNDMDLTISNSKQSTTVELPDPEKTTANMSAGEKYTNVMNAWNVFQKVNEFPTESINYAPNQQSPDGSIKSWFYYSKQSQTTKDFLGKDKNTGNSRCDRVYSSDNIKVPKVLQVHPIHANIQSWFNPDSENNKFVVSSIDLKESTKGTTRNSSPSYDSFIVESVSFDGFIANPSEYTDPNKYKVIMFGTFDANNNKDLSPTAVGYLESYVSNGGKIILGHDTAYHDHPNFMQLAQDLGLLDKGWSTDVQLNGGDLTQSHYYKDAAATSGDDRWTSVYAAEPYPLGNLLSKNAYEKFISVLDNPNPREHACLFGTYFVLNANSVYNEYNRASPGDLASRYPGKWNPDSPPFWSLVTPDDFFSLTYPNKIRYFVNDMYDNQKILRVPPCHTTGQVLSNGATIDLRFSDITSKKKLGYNAYAGSAPIKWGDESSSISIGINSFINFYLAHNPVGNVYMFQTGHSNGLASMQEKQLWADVIYKLCHNEDVTNRNVELKLGDYNPPYLKNSPTVNNQNKLFINVEDESSGNAFVPNYTDVTKDTSAVSYSNNYRFSADNKGYAYFFSDNDFGVPDKDECNGDEDELARYQPGDFETYTFQDWKTFNDSAKNESDYDDAEEAFKNSTVVKSSGSIASIDLNDNSNGYKYLYICLFDNSTRMATNKADLDSLGYDGLANELTLQNEDSSFDEKLHNEWEDNSDLNWEVIRKYGNRTVIRVKLAVNKVTTHITKSHYIDDSTPDRFWTNESYRSDSKAATESEVITTVTRFSKYADKNAQKIIAIGASSTPSASLDNAKAWIDPESNSKEIVDADLVKSIKVVGTEPTGDFITYTVEWTIAKYKNSPANTGQLFYNYAYIGSIVPVSNGCQENFTVDTQSPKITYKPYNSGTKYDIKVLDSNSNDGTIYQSGLNSIKVNLIDEEGDRTETSCRFTRDGNKRVNEETLTLETDLSSYSKIEIVAEDNVGNKSKSTINIPNKPDEENSGEVHASLKNWYYSSNSKNKWVSGSSNPSMIKSSNQAYISIDSPSYNLIHNQEYAGRMATFKAVSQNLIPDGDPETHVGNGQSKATLTFKNYGGIFNPSLLEKYNYLNGSTELSNIINYHNDNLSIDTGAMVKYDGSSPSDNLDKYTYYRDIPIKGIRDVVGRELALNIANEQEISATQPCYYYTYTQEEKEVTPAWDEYEEDTGKFIKHHEAKPEMVTITHKHNTSVNYSSKESVESSVTLDDALSVDSTKPSIEVKKTGRYTNEVSITDLDKNGAKLGASGIHKIKLGLSNYSSSHISNCYSAFDGPNEYMMGSGVDTYIDCWKGQTPNEYENNVSIDPVHELTFNLDCFRSDRVPNYLHERVDTSKYKIYKYLIYEIEDNVGNRITGYADLKPTTVDTTITEDGRPPKDYPEDNSPDRPNPTTPVNPNGPDGKLYDKNVSINATPTKITDPRDSNKKRKIVDVEVNASITNPTPGFSPVLEIWGYGKNDEYRRPSDFTNLINKTDKNEMSKFGERPLTKDTYAEIYVDDTYNTPNKPTAHVDISSTASLLKFKKLEDPKLPYFFEVYTKTCNAEDWIKEVDTLHPLYFASGYNHNKVKIYKVDGDHKEPSPYWKSNPVLSGKYFGAGLGEGSVDISNLRTGWYKAEITMYDFNGNPSGTEEIWFYQNQPALYTPFNVSISAVKDVDWEGDVKFGYNETKVPSTGINKDVKDDNTNGYESKDVEINQDSNRRPGSFISDTGESDYYPLGLVFGANGDNLKKIDWGDSSKTSYTKPKDTDEDKGNPIGKGYAVNWKFSKENKQQLSSLSLNYSYRTTNGDLLTIYDKDGSTKLQDDPANGVYVNKQEMTSNQLTQLNSKQDFDGSLDSYLKPPAFDDTKSMFTSVPVKHFLPETFVAKKQDGSIYNGVVIVTVTFKGSIKEGTMSTNAVDQSIELYAIYQGETAIDDITLDRQR